MSYQEDERMNETTESSQQAPESAAEGQKAQGPQGASEGQGPSEVESLRQQVEEWRAKADELLDKYKRSLADFANYRKRQDRDREEQTLQIRMEVLRQILPIVDDFERALKNVPQEYAQAGWVEGITLIERKLKSMLAKFDVSPIEALGKPFDPNFHSALVTEESDEYPPGTVMEELQRGYLLADRLLRPTIVKVSNGPRAKPEEGAKQVQQD